MMIYGYRGTIDLSKVRNAFKKHTELTATEIETHVKTIKSGGTVNIPADFVLFDDLKELGLFVK